MQDEVLKFWFEDIEPVQWWKKDDKFDALISDKFAQIHAKASQCELFTWRTTVRGRLAEILILDQFSRNIYRNSPLAFANDAMALCLAQEAVASKVHLELEALERSFLYMPYMHSESLLVHLQAERLFKDNGIESNYEFEIKHKEIIEKFGRYPHRNSLLGRESTPEELVFLQQPGSAF